MPSTVVLGLQWGDEGKGKIVDALAEHHDMVVRYNGGANSGHTVKVGEIVYKFHLIPSGIIQGKPSIIGNGEVVDPEVLVEEMKQVEAFRENLYISDRAHLVLPQHKAWEAALEEAKGKGRIGTTGRGIGTTYAAKMLRPGVRVGDVIDRHGRVDRDNFRRALQEDPLFDILERTYGKKVSREEILEKYCMLAENFSDRVADTSLMIWEALYRDSRHVLFEGAQAAMLDIDHGTYPFVTSSSPTIGGASTGSGVHVKPDRVIGVVKAYTTRVGGGPFPTEFADEELVRREFPSSEELKAMGLTIQQWEAKNYDRAATLEAAGRGYSVAVSRFVRVQGGEYGTTTGRPRRGGWFDAVAARYAIRVNGVRELAVMKLDVLSGLPGVSICTRYKLEEDTTDEFPSRTGDVGKCLPCYESAEGWVGDIRGAKSDGMLPCNALFYVDALEERMGRPVSMISVGPERNETIYRKHPK